MEARIDTFLELAVQQAGSDLHLVSGEPPRIRIRGELHAVRFRVLTVEDLERILGEFLPEEARAGFASGRTVEFGYEAPGIGRFRVSAYRHVGGLAVALRVLAAAVPPLESIGLPESVRGQVSQPSGLTLVTGPSGSGKSTTLAAMVDHVNRTRRGHVVTIEDPIEYLHAHGNCSITQREIGAHALSFSEALRDAVREDPDVILIGEMRDAETIGLALTAAETGTQVLATLHTTGASRTIHRIVNVFPPRRQTQVRAMLADSLRMIVSQRLVRTATGDRRMVAAEVLVNTYACSSMIRTGNTHKLESVIQAGGSAGMQSLDGGLKELLRRKEITPDEAYLHAIDKTPFERLRTLPEAA